jgi:endonuclease/exonuclease/phosphatase family metal-dependent hydrolase
MIKPARIIGSTPAHYEARTAATTVLLVLFIATVALLSSCRSVTNFPDPDEPRYEGNYSDGAPLNSGAPEFDGLLKVVTWNIAFAEEIEEAIAELNDNEELNGADILLLQEMDDAGTEAIAQALNYNYVYYPASIHNHHDKNFGNAVLSKWPIVDSEKLILPHQNPRNDQIRIAVRALISIDGVEVPVYSVHTETFWLGQQDRSDQIGFLAEKIDPDYTYAIAGGDFNTLTPGSIDVLEQQLGEVGLERVSAGAGETVGVGDIGLTLDHIFARGMSTVSTGVVYAADASDHFPLWAELLLDRDA